MYNVYVPNQRKKENEAMRIAVDCLGMFLIGLTWYVFAAILFIY